MKHASYLMFIHFVLFPLPANALERSFTESKSLFASSKRSGKRVRKRRGKRSRSKQPVAPQKPSTEQRVEEKKAKVVEQKVEPEPVKPGVAILDMAVIEGVGAGVARIVNELLVTRLARADVFGSVIGSSDIAQMVTLEQQKVLLGCEEESCIAQLGGALGVPLMIVPGIGKLGNEFVMTLKITDVEAATVKVRQSITVPDEPAMATGMEWLVDASLAEFTGQPMPPMPVLKRTAPLAPVGLSPVLKTSLVVGTGVLGAGLVGFGFLQAADSRSEFKDRQDVDSFRRLEAAVQTGNRVAGVGYTIIAGALLWGLY